MPKQLRSTPVVESPPLEADDPLLRLTELESLVAEKDQLLGQVTQRLEQAAEQLDRLHREGVRPVGADLPARPRQEKIEDQPTLVSDLQQMLQEWQNLQVDGWFGRLDCQVAELRDLIANRTFEATAATTAEEEPQPSLLESLSKLGAEIASAHATGGSRTAGQARSHSSSGQSEPMSWEQTKAALLSGENPPEQAQASQDTEPHIQDFQITSGLTLPDAPPHHDWSLATPDELRHAISARDDYILALQDRLQALEAEYHSNREIPDLGALTADQQHQLDEWLSAEQQELRQTQVALSLERAQMSREQMQLRRDQEALQKELKRLKSPGKAGAVVDETAPAEESPPAKKGWRGLFR